MPLLQQDAPLHQEDVPLEEEQAPLQHRVAVDLGEQDKEDMLVDVQQLLLNDQGQAEAKQKFKLDDETREFFALPILESEIGLKDGKLFCCLPTYSLACLPGYLLTCLPNTCLLTYLITEYLSTCLPI